MSGKVYIFGGGKSQTDLAADQIEYLNSFKRYTYNAENAQEWFSDASKFPEGSVLLPIWNLYGGKVKKADFLYALENEYCELNLLYPKHIYFKHCSYINGNDVNTNCQDVLSVDEAKPQCSDYLMKNELLDSFVGKESTNKAKEVFLKNECGSIISAPEMVDEIKGQLGDDVEVTKDIENKDNYTVFGCFQKQCEKGEAFPVYHWLVSLQTELKNLEDEDWVILQENIIGQGVETDQKLCIFVARMDEDNRLLLLVETNYELESLAPTQDTERSLEIMLVGRSDYCVTNELSKIVSGAGIYGNFSDGESTQPALVAYPDLGIYLHGYCRDTVIKFAQGLVEIFRNMSGMDEGLQGKVRDYENFIHSEFSE